MTRKTPRAQSRRKNMRALLFYISTSYKGWNKILKFSTLTDHMIKCFLTEWEGRTGNIWLSVMTYGPRCTRSASHNL